LRSLAQVTTRAVQPGHDGADGAVERARDLAVAQLFDLGELEDAPLGRCQRGQRSGEVALVERRRLGLARGLRGHQRHHARPQALVAHAAAALTDGEVAQDAAQPRAAVRARLVAMARGDGARERLLHEVVGVGAGPATGEARKETRVWVQLGDEFVKLHGRGCIAAGVPGAISRGCGAGVPFCQRAASRCGNESMTSLATRPVSERSPAARSPAAPCR